MAWEFFQLVGVSRPRSVGKTEPTLRARAMRFLARREHSRRELERKLYAVASGGEDVQALLDELARTGWLSDARFAELAVRARSRRFGPMRVTHHLRSKGVDDEAIATAFREAGSDGTADIGRVWRSRFSSAPVNDRERGRQVRFLQGRGFALSQVLKFLKEPTP